jgi:hypothetical protein
MRLSEENKRFGWGSYLLQERQYWYDMYDHAHSIATPVIPASVIPLVSLSNITEVI